MSLELVEHLATPFQEGLEVPRLGVGRFVKLPKLVGDEKRVTQVLINVVKIAI